jgi:AAA domain
METQPGRTLFMSAEDDRDELHRRLDRMRVDLNLQWADLADLHVWPLVGEDATLGFYSKPKGKVIATSLLATVEERIRDTMIDTVILDTLSDVFCGDENDKQQARAFIHLLKGLAPQDRRIGPGAGASLSQRHGNRHRDQRIDCLEQHRTVAALLPQRWRPRHPQAASHESQLRAGRSLHPCSLGAGRLCPGD